MFRKKRINLAQVTELKKTLHQACLNTVCESAKCPNIGECFAKKIATFLIAGNICTRGCRFCGVDKGRPLPLDAGEPDRVSRMIADLGLKYVVITSVTRDDLSDGGAGHYAAVLTAVRSARPDTKIEVLVPDFKGDQAAAAVVFAAAPEVFAHNLETVPRLYSSARSGADYERSLRLLRLAKERGLTTKSGVMLGLGEREEEVLRVMDDLRAAGCDILTIGQYLAPTKDHHEVKEFIAEDQFARLKVIAMEKGFRHCASGSYVRSSYMADTML